MENSITAGGCFCGQVLFSFTGLPINVINCHCSMCRRMSGAAFSTWVSVDETAFRLEKAESLKSFNPSKHGSRNFCGECGTHVFTKDARFSGTIGIPVGVLSKLPKALDGHYFVDHRAQWNTICDDLPQFGGETGYERKSANTSPGNNTAANLSARL